MVYMKNLLTILATVFITVWVMIWWNAIMNNSSWNNWEWNNQENWSRISSLFSFGAGDSGTDKNKLVANTWLDTKGNEIKTEWDLILCPENESPKLNPLTGDFECVIAAPVITDCVRPIDGEAYPDGDTQIGYKAAIKNDTNLNPECEQVTFTCKEGKYQSNKWELKDFNRGECVIIDKTNTDLTTCTYNGQEYNMWEEIYTHIKEKVQSDSVCRYAKFKCVASEDLESERWERYSTFDLDIYQYESCEVSQALSDEYIKENLEELLEMGVVIEEKDDNGEVAVIQNISHTVQSLWDEEWCTAFDQTYDHGDSKRFFEYKTTAYTTTCNYVSVNCVDGDRQPYSPENFNWVEYPHPTCKIEWPGTCTIGNTVITDTQSWVFYDYGKKNSTTGERECESQLKYCEAPLDWEWTTHYDNIDGKIAANKKYIYTSCNIRADYVAPAAKKVIPAPIPKPTPKPVAAPVKTDASKLACPSPYIWETASWSAGQTGVGYDISSVAFDSSDTCSAHAINLQCYFGHVRPVVGGSPGKTKYVNNLYRSCAKGTPAACTFNYIDTGESIKVAHGSTAPYCTVGSLEYGQSESDYRTTSLCTNGNMQVNSWYKFCAVAKAASCASPCWAIAHGASIKTYTTSSLPFRDGISSCDVVSNVVVNSTCNNGKFNVSPWAACSCTVAAPRSCGSTPHKSILTLQKNVPCQAQAEWDQLNGQTNESCGTLRGSATCYDGSYINATANRPLVQWGTPQ